MPQSPHIRLARWPKATGELERCIGAESVRSIGQERELCCLMRCAGTFIRCVDNVKNVNR